MTDFVWTDLENAVPGQPESGSTAVVEPLNAMGHEVKRLGQDKVDKETGKGLSANDFTDELKDKLDDIETGAEVNAVDDVTQNGESVVENKIAKIDAYTKEDALSIMCPQTETTNTTITDAVTHNAIDYTIYGNTGGVGDEVTEGEHAGEYAIPVKVSGKNIWNSNIIQGYRRFSDGDYANDARYGKLYVVNQSPISVKEGETYTISANNYNPSVSAGFAFFNDGVHVSSQETTALTTQIPNGVNQLYYNFRLGIEEISPNTFSNIQLEANTISTNYEPYRDPTITNIYLDDPLEEGESVSLADTQVPIPLVKNTNIIEFMTENQPSSVKFKYYQDINKIGGSGAVASVNGKTGVVILAKRDIGLGNVDNTSDANKPISTAQQTEFNNKQDKIDNNLETVSKNIVGAINETNSIAKGAQQAISYNNYQAMITAFNALDDDAYPTGQSIYIVTIDVPDLWISSVESTSSTYTYTTDIAFVTALETNGYVQVGYYKLSALETGKVDLTGYEQTSNKVTSISSSSTDTQYPSAKCVYDELVDKQDAQATVSQSAPSTITLADNTTYYLSNVSSLTLTYPQDTHWECLLQFETSSSGTVTVTFPNTTKYIGDVPTFDNSGIWEISIKDGIVVAQKAVSASA